MATYRGGADRADRAKAIGAVALIHAGLAFVVLAGLAGSPLRRQAIETLKTFDVLPDPPPPPPQIVEARAPEQAAPEHRQATPTEIVAPKPRLVVTRPPVSAAPIAGTGAASEAGAGRTGNGTGAGGTGTGLGGGGGTHAIWVSGGLRDSDYPPWLKADGVQGVVAVLFTVEPDGRPDDCRIDRSSGSRELDSLTCRLVEQRLRYQPARDAAGRPVAERVGKFYTWGIRNRY